MLALLAVAAQAVTTVPPVVRCTPDQIVAPPASKPGSLSLVIATSGVQDDPRPAACGPDGTGGDSLFRSRFTGARTLAGTPLEASFAARVKLHSPFISRYRLAIILERQADGSLLARRMAGFNGRTGVACFDSPEEWPVDWQPEAPELRREGKSLCVFDAGEIDPNAPKG
jgi:hypothetical protein